MKTLKTRHTRILVGALALAGLFATAPVARADDEGRRGVLSSTSIERITSLAHRLEEFAQHANEQAQAQQAGYRGFRRDTKFLKSIDHFADRARRFHQRLESYRTQPWNVDEELEHLIRDARNVQKRLQRARFVDQHTVQDWNQGLNILSQMSTEYRSGTGYPSNSPYGSRDSRDSGHAYPGESGRPNTGYDPHRSTGSHDRDGYGNTTDLRQLAYELDQRAARASDLAGRSSYGRSENNSDLRRFSEKARSFRALVDQNRLTRSQLRSEVNELLEDAQDAYDDLRRSNISRELSNEWDGVVQILNRMRAIVIA